MKEHNSSLWLCILSSLALAFFIAFLYRLTEGALLRGTDTPNYVRYFIENNYYFIEPLFVIFSKLIRNFTYDPKIYLFILDYITNFLSFLSICCIHRRVYRGVPHVFFFFVLLLSFSSYHLMQINAIRQSLGLPFAIFSLCFFLTSNYKLSVIFLLFASAFHTSYLILFVTYTISYLLKRNLKLFSFLYIFIAAVVSSMLLYLPKVVNLYVIWKFQSLNRPSTGIIPPILKYFYLWFIFIVAYLAIFRSNLQKRFFDLILIYYSFLLSLLPFIRISMIINRYFLLGEVLLILLMPLILLRMNKYSRWMFIFAYSFISFIFLINFPTIRHEFHLD